MTTEQIIVKAYLLVLEEKIRSLDFLTVYYEQGL